MNHTFRNCSLKSQACFQGQMVRWEVHIGSTACGQDSLLSRSCPHAHVVETGGAVENVVNALMHHTVVRCYVWFFALKLFTNT